MSLVGTRPPTLDEWNQYKPHHRARMSFRPGLTGLWQVSGRSNITDFRSMNITSSDYVSLPGFVRLIRRIALAAGYIVMYLFFLYLSAAIFMNLLVSNKTATVFCHKPINFVVCIRGYSLICP